MTKLSKLCLSMMMMMGAHFAYSQSTSSKLNLGNANTFLNKLATTSSNQKTSSPLSLKVSPTESLPVKVNYKKTTAAGQSIMGEVTGKNSGSFYLVSKGNKLEGNIVLPEAKIAYKYSSDNSGNATIESVDIDGVICIDMEHAPAPAVPATSTPVGAQIGVGVLTLQSLAGAAGCVMLDVDGYYMAAGNYWNNGNPINAAASGMSDADIQELWEVVSEDYRPFNMNVTTSEAVFNSYPKNRRMRCVITPTNTAAPGAGGVAYISSFNWDNDVPCWVFITSGKAGGEATSHEIGHTLGLGHDGRNSPAEGYYAGQGDWAPIMGVGYYKPISQWSRGEYNSANNTEDDLSIMASATYGVGYRNDDFGNSTGAAANINADANGNVSAENNKGVIERTTDIDFFTFLTAGGNVTFNVNTVVRHGDLDILVRLYNSSGAQIGSFNPTGLNALVTATLGAGRYYLSVDGTGAGNPATDGYSDYASLGSYFISGNFTPASTVNENAVATFYKDCNYGGYAVGLEEGDYTLAQLQAKGISDNDISSLKVNFGYKVIVYVDNNYAGASATLSGDDNCLVDNNLNDVISSLKIRANGITTIGGKFYVQNRNSNLYMDVWGLSTDDGGNIAQGGYNGGTNQQFEFLHLGDGVYKITAQNSGKSMDVAGVSKADGANIHQWGYVGGNNQKFILLDAGNGFYKLVAKHSSKIVEVAGASTANGANIQQWSNHDGTHGHWKIVPVTVTPPPFTTTIQAENYSAMAGVQTEATTDAGGGLNVGYIDNPDWMAYNSITFPSSGNYLVEYRVASVGGGQLSLDLNAGTIQLGAVNIPATGGWQNWTTVSHTVFVNAGTYNVGIFAQTSGWNINWFRITRVANASNASTVKEGDVQPLTNGASGKSSLAIYPNPVDKEATLTTNYDLQGAHLKIYNAAGTVVMEKASVNEILDLSGLDQGMFTLVVITKDNTKIVERFIKQ